MKNKYTKEFLNKIKTMKVQCCEKVNGKIIYLVKSSRKDKIYEVMCIRDNKWICDCPNNCYFINNYYCSHIMTVLKEYYNDDYKKEFKKIEDNIKQNE